MQLTQKITEEKNPHFFKNKNQYKKLKGIAEQMEKPTPCSYTEEDTLILGMPVLLWLTKAFPSNISPEILFGANLDLLKNSYEKRIWQE